MLDYIFYTFPYHISLIFSAFLLLLSFFLVFFVVVQSLKASRDHAVIPQSLPWSGRLHGQLLASVRANYRGFVDSINLYTSGYQKYSKMGKIFVVPTWTRGPQIITPPSMVNWIGSKPDDMLNAKDCTFDNVQFAYTVKHPEITSNDMLDVLIKRELTRNIGVLNHEILEEIDASMEEMFGNDGQWRQVGVWDSLTRTVGRAANRVFVGKELCFNMDFVLASVRFARDVSVSSYILHLFPKFMKPAVAWFATIPNRRNSAIAMKYLLPLVEKRMEDMNRKKADPNYAFEEPDDFITWMVRESWKRNTEDERSVYSLAYRIVLLQFASVTTTTITATNSLLDIWSAPNSDSVIAALREEAEKVYHEHNGEWSKAALAKLHRLDSAIRESARFSAIGGTAMARKVRADGGITLPDGTWVPKNVTVGVSMDGIHFDEAFYNRPTEFDPFRFSRPREEAALSGEKLRVNEDLVTTSPHWLPFSHGIHACPGRFFAVNNIKMILAHLLLNYDVQPFPTRPPNISIGEMSVVPVKAEMMVRRREVKA